jgi:hypothetical protein
LFYFPTAVSGFILSVMLTKLSVVCGSLVGSQSLLLLSMNHESSNEGDIHPPAIDENLNPNPFPSAVKVNV